MSRNIQTSHGKTARMTKLPARSRVRHDLSHPARIAWLLFLLVVAATGAEGEPGAGEPPADGQAQSPEAKQATKETSQPAKKQGTKKTGKKQAAKKDAEKAESADKKPPAGKKSASPAQAASDEDREQAALALVREHHPDLVALLERLKATKQKDYRQAVRELYRDSQRLENFRHRDAERYGLELRAWQLASRVRLLAAKLSLEDRPEFQEDLKAALAEQADVRLAIKKLEHGRLVARLGKIDQEIAGLTSQREENLKRTLDRFLNAAAKARSEKRKTGATKVEAASKFAPAVKSENLKSKN